MKKIKLNCDVVILDYSTSEIRCVNLPADLVTRNTQSEDVEEYLRNNCGFKDSTCYWMSCTQETGIVVPNANTLGEETNM